MIGIYKIKIVENEHLYGPGKRLLIFLKGCTIHCKGCVNKHLWSFEDANFMSSNDVLNIAIKENVEGITLHGGEPLDQACELVELIKLIKDNNMSVILFTGYKKKELNKSKIKVWNMADIVISGRFEIDKINVNLQFRGSNNQRIYTHRGKYKNYKVNDGKTSTILTLDNEGNLDINGFLTSDILKIIK